MSNRGVVQPQTIHMEWNKETEEWAVVVISIVHGPEESQARMEMAFGTDGNPMLEAAVDTLEQLVSCDGMDFLRQAVTANG